jgi:hypothetical protein
VAVQSGTPLTNPSLIEMTVTLSPVDEKLNPPIAQAVPQSKRPRYGLLAKKLKSIADNAFGHF